MYRKKTQGWLKHLDFLLLDIICLQLSFLLAYFIKNHSFDLYSSSSYQNMIIIMMLIDIIVAVFGESYKNILKKGYYRIFMTTLKHVGMVELLSVLYLFTIKESSSISRMVIYIHAILYLVISYFAKLCLKIIIKRIRSDWEGRSLLIITTSDLAKKVIHNIGISSYDTIFVTGVAVLDKDMRGKVIDGVKIVADYDSVTDYVCREWIDEVFISVSESRQYPDALIDRFLEMGVVVHVKLLNVRQLRGNKQFVEQLGNYAVLTSSINYMTASQAFMKRTMDIVGGIAGCILTGLLILIIGPMIYIQSPGPVFFSQVRVGKNGKRFKMYKFRSMYTDAEKKKEKLMAANRVKDGRMFKLDWDPRIIGCRRLADGTIKKGIGNFIRDYSLDEFPQFFNVLKGDMSLVGTRPPTVDEWEKYELHHRARLAIKPGITGMWQVSGRSNFVDFEEVVNLDKQYISEWSIGMDIKILLKTVLVVIKKEGAM